MPVLRYKLIDKSCKLYAIEEEIEKEKKLREDLAEISFSRNEIKASTIFAAWMFIDLVVIKYPFDPRIHKYNGSCALLDSCIPSNERIMSIESRGIKPSGIYEERTVKDARFAKGSWRQNGKVEIIAAI